MFFLSDDPLFSDEELLLMCAASGGKTVEDTATGNPLTFITDIAKPLKSLLIPFTPKQSGTGDPSPQNIRSILPWNGFKVFGGGKNLFDVSTVVKGTLDGTGALVDNNNRRTSAYITLGAGKYKLSRKTLVDWWKAWSYKLDGTPISKLFDGNGYEVTLTLTEMCMIRISFDYVVTDENEVQLEAGETVTAYEEYHPITETDIVFPSPVYGGTLDVVSGVLKVEWRLRSMGGTGWDSFNRETSHVHPFFYGGFNDREKGRTTDFMADCFKKDTVNVFGSTFGTNAEDLSISFSADINSTNVYIRDDSCSTREEFLQKYANRYVAYKLAEPQTVQLTPTQLTALLGNNTIWSDADGSMTAVYLKKG
jgi:hypothetical protein